MEKDTKLNDRQLRFVEEYLLDYNATAAAIRAGYSPKSAKTSGCSNLKIPEVIEMLTAAKIDISSNITITKDQMVTDIIAIRNLALTKGQMNTALKASEILNKMLGYDAPVKQETTFTGITWVEEKNYNLPPKKDDGFDEFDI